MGCCRLHTLPQECHGGTKRDRRKIYQVRKGQVQIFEAHQVKCLSVHCKCYSDELFVTKTTNSKTLF